MSGSRKIVLFALIRSGKILLEKRSIEGFDKPQYLIPGGAINDHLLEKLEDALKREMMEELGVTPINFELLTEEDIPGIFNNMLKAFAVTSWEGEIPEIILDKEDPHPLEWIDIDKSIDLLPAMATKEIIQSLKEYLAKK